MTCSQFIGQSLLPNAPYETQHIPHPAGPKRAELLYEAKYGDRGADGKMTREQVGAGARNSNGGAVRLCNLVV